MILYVNGDSHSAGYDAGGPIFSYGKHLAKKFNAQFKCSATPGCSNDRIIRTTREFLKNNNPDIVVIGWTSWEREEWIHNGKYYCVNCSGHSVLPKELELKYKNWVIDKDHNSILDERKYHQQIWDLHQELLDKNIPHLFFNCYLCFNNMVTFNDITYDWGLNYLDPYNVESTYWHYLNNQGFESNQYLHFGADAHVAWADFLYPHLTKLL